MLEPSRAQADELLPGVALDQCDVPGVAWVLPLITPRLAASGDACAMLECANELASAAGETASSRGAGGEERPAAEVALEWVESAIAAVAAAPAAEAAQLALGGCAAHQLLERKAELLLQLGRPAAASESYEAASEAALEAGKAKIAMRLQAKAAECAPEEEEEEEGAAD